jgi:hypothetical protein
MAGAIPDNATSMDGCYVQIDPDIPGKPFLGLIDQTISDLTATQLGPTGPVLFHINR